MLEKPAIDFTHAMDGVDELDHLKETLDLLKKERPERFQKLFEASQKDKC
jgi:hypothetical protein